MNGVRVFLMIFIAGIATSCVAAVPADTHHAFWAEFRQAVEDDDIQHVAMLTKFPFRTRGVDDAMPVVSYDEQEFTEIFPLILKTEVPRQLEDGSLTLKQFILEKQTLKTEDFSSQDQLWIGDFKFDRTEEGWRLSFVYWSEDQVDP